MGQIESGKWIIGLMIYFFMFFVVVNTFVSILNYYSVDTDIYFDDTGFGGSNPDNNFSNEYNSSSNIDISTWRQSINIITGIGVTEVNIGVPDAYMYIFSFIFFWLPSFILLTAIYFALPFLH